MVCTAVMDFNKNFEERGIRISFSKWPVWPASSDFYKAPNVTSVKFTCTDGNSGFEIGTERIDNKWRISTGLKGVLVRSWYYNQLLLWRNLRSKRWRPELTKIFNGVTWILDSVTPNLAARWSLSVAEGYWLTANADSSSCSWSLVYLMRSLFCVCSRGSTSREEKQESSLSRALSENRYKLSRELILL